MGRFEELIPEIEQTLSKKTRGWIYGYYRYLYQFPSNFLPPYYRAFIKRYIETIDIYGRMTYFFRLTVYDENCNVYRDNFYNIRECISKLSSVIFFPVKYFGIIKIKGIAHKY